MAAFVLKDASVTVNSVDLSDHVTEVKVESTKPLIDITAMGAANKVYATGIGDGTITVTFLQDFASGKVDATLNGLQSAGTTFPVIVKPTSAAVGTTNPTYTATCVLANYSPINGKIDDASSVQAVFQNASQTGIVRATS